MAAQHPPARDLLGEGVLDAGLLERDRAELPSRLGSAQIGRARAAQPTDRGNRWLVQLDQNRGRRRS